MSGVDWDIRGDVDLLPAERCCECCGKPVDRDDFEVPVDARDLANWLADVWWLDARLAGLIFARLMLPRAPLRDLACLLAVSPSTATRLWKRLEEVSPDVAAWARGAERRGGDRRRG